MGAVGPVGVVVVSPVLDDDPGFQERVEAPRVEQLVAQSAVEGFDPSVRGGRTLPGRYRRMANQGR